MRQDISRKVLFIVAVMLLGGVGSLLGGAGVAQAGDLRLVEDFASIDDPATRSLAIFDEIGKVLLHPRCINCHPAGDRPLQGEDGRVHEPPVERATGGFGATGMRCVTCHLDENFDPGGVPGAPHWRLAPRKMAWEGLSLGEICEQIQDPDRNGRRDLEKLAEHMEEDALVAWGWTPGTGREPAPDTQAAFGALVRAWIESGAVCPE